MWELLNFVIVGDGDLRMSGLDNYKVEIHGRFRHFLNSLAALEARLCKLESVLGIEYKPWVPIKQECYAIAPANLDGKKVILQVRQEEGKDPVAYYYDYETKELLGEGKIKGAWGSDPDLSRTMKEV